MIETFAKHGRKGVICIFCGIPTPLPPGHDERAGFSVLRCHACGKEAPYPEAYVIEMPARELAKAVGA